MTAEHAPNGARSRQLEDKLDVALARLEQARPFAKIGRQGPVLDLVRRLLLQPGGLEQLYELAPRLDEAGVFVGTDWDDPGTLLPSLVANTLQHADLPAVAR